MEGEELQLGRISTALECDQNPTYRELGIPHGKRQETSPNVKPGYTNGARPFQVRRHFTKATTMGLKQYHGKFFWRLSR